MRTEYTLFLDESLDKETNVFCIAGCIIKNSNISKLDNSIDSIKKIIWTEEYISSDSPILHSNELNFIYNNRKNSKLSQYTKNAYTVFNTKNAIEIKEIYDQVYEKFCYLLKSQNIVTLCCIIDCNKFEQFYSLSNNDNIFNDWFDIAMQVIIENYTHFLCSVNGVGSIIYEARNNNPAYNYNSSDHKMLHNFYKSKVNGKGILLLKPDAILERIHLLDFVTKKGNLSGLQLADFIAFNFIKWYDRNDNNLTEFMKKIHKNAYNGSKNLSSLDLRAYFGTRILPENLFELHTTKNELKKIKKSYHNLKNDRNKLNKQLKTVLNEKKLLQQKYNELLEKNENTK